jgi:hypothetical protein
MAEVSREIRDRFSGSIAIIAQLNDPNVPEDMAPISLLCEATDNNLPGIWLVHS